MPILGVISSGISGHLETNSFASIATVTVGSGGQANVTFSSIPATYKHLQIRGSSKSTRITGAGQENIYFSFNSDTGSNYAQHGLQGNSSSRSSYGTANCVGDNVIAAYTANSETNVLGAQIIDILDYANTNKYKTLRGLSGFVDTSVGFVLFSSALWKDTTAINSIKLTVSSGTFKEYSKFALYGIKG